MNKSQMKERSLDDQLADFTDNILSENIAKLDKTPSTPDTELHDLQQTTLRLKNAFHENGLSEEVIQRMRKNIVMQWQQQENKESKPFLNKLLCFFQLPDQGWKSQHNRQQLGTVSFAVTVLVIFFISIFFFNGVFSAQPASSGHNLNPFLLATSGGLLILLALWLYHRKP